MGPMSPLRARLLGRPAFESGGVEIGCPSRKALWLAAYVLMARNAQARTRLAGLFWGGESPRHALGSLRVALTKLPPKVMACLEVTRADIGPAAKVSFDVDVEEFVAACAGSDADAKRAVSLYAGDLMLGVEEEAAPVAANTPVIDELVGANARERLTSVKRVLQSLLDLLGNPPTERRVIKAKGKRSAPTPVRKKVTAKRSGGAKRRRA